MGAEGGSDVERHLPLSADGKRRLRQALRRSAGARRSTALDARAVFVLASGTLARTTDCRRPAPSGARQPHRRGLREDRRPYAAHRCRGRGQRGAGGRRRPARHPGRRLGHRCRQDGGALPRQRRHRALAARPIPRRDRRRRHDAAPGGRAAGGADRSRSRRHCRPASSPRRPAAPTRRGTSRRATAIR